MPKTKIKKWLKRIITVSLLSVVLSLGLTVSTTYAVDCASIGAGDSTCTKAESDACPSGFTAAADKTTCNKTATSQAATDQEIAQANFLAGLQKALNRLIWPILVLIGGLMDNGLLFGNGMEQKLQDIWIPIRNLVNILFVIVLVGIALYNVLGIGDESGNYSIKSALPKIIIGIIAVNFSFLAIKVFLDAINVLTSSVFNLPGQVSEGLATVVSANSSDNERDKDMIARLCASLGGMTVQQMSSKSDEVLSKNQADAIARSIAVDPQFGLSQTNTASMSFEEIKAKIQEGDGGDTKVEIFQNKFNSASEGQICEGSKLSGQGEAFLSRWNSRNAAFAMALSMAKMVYYQDVHPESLQDVQKLAINTLFSFFMYLIFTISFLALFVVLLARLVVMWLSIALSPVLILILAAPTLKEKMGGFNKIAENFVKLAIAPLIIALSMTIGWIMLNAIRGLDAFSKTSALSIDPTQGIPIVGLSTIQDLTVAVGTIAIIWLGVFGAAEGTIAEKATGFMKDNFQRFGTYIGTIPFKHIPFIPISLPSGETYKATGGEALYALERSFQKESTGLWDKIRPDKPITADTLHDKSRVREGQQDDFFQFLHSRGNELTSAADVTNLKNLEKDRPDIWNNLSQAERSAIQKFVRDPQAKDAVSDLLKAGRIKGKGPLPAIPKEPTTPSATPPAAPAAAQTVNTNGKIIKSDGSVVGDAKFGGKTVQEIYDTALGTTGAVEIGQFNNRLGTLAAVTKETKKEDVLTAAKNVHLNPGNGTAAVAPTLAELKTLLGDAKYDEVVKAAGGAAALQKALDEGATAAATAPAPAPTPAPAAPAPVAPAPVAPPEPEGPASGRNTSEDAEQGI